MVKMKYMGSKARIAKHILPIILKDRKEGQWYVEPFVGGANVIDKVDGNRIGSDSNNHLIKALKLIRDNPDSIPSSNREYTEEMYNLAKEKNNPSDVECLMLFVLSYGARFRNSFARGHIGEDFVRAAKNSAMKQSEKLKSTSLLCSNYDDLKIPSKSVIYCDPPYENTAKYKADFNHDKFWQWCREKIKEGHQVFVSEYNAPDDFVCVWQKEINSNVNAKATSTAIEKLFIHESQVKP